MVRTGTGILRSGNPHAAVCVLADAALLCSDWFLTTIRKFPTWITSPGRPLPQTRGRGEGGGNNLSVEGLPLIKPPYGQITAIDMDKGEIRWQIAHGATPDNVRNNPALKGLDIPRTGNSNAQGTIGTLVTKTMVVAGEGDLRRRCLRASAAPCCEPTTR